MREKRLDLVDPRSSMESEYLSTCGKDGDFGFAFNDSNFSDRVLQIEVVADPSEIGSDVEGFHSLTDWARHRKRRRDDLKKDADVGNAGCPEEILNPTQPDIDEVDKCENEVDETVAIAEKLGPGEEASNDNNSYGITDCSTVVRFQSLYICSPILAAKSPFFYKLFSNGMRESEQRHVTIRIHTSEEAALMELLNFMYSNTLKPITAPALLDVLMAADKFEVASCMRYCSKILRNLPMTLESALLYLELPSSVLMAEAVRPLTDAAKQFLVARYKDVSKYLGEVMNLPLAAFEVILSSDDLQVASEDAVYDLVLRWARAQYPNPEVRKEVFGSTLLRCIRFPYMTCRRLKKVLTSNEFDPALASKVVLESLFFKAEPPHRQKSLVAEDSMSSSSSRRFVERGYKYRPIKVVEFEHPHQQCIVYLDLKKEECANLFPSGRLYSQVFHLGGHGFFLSAHCNMDQQSLTNCFGMFLGLQEKGSVSFGVDYEFAARLKPTEEYTSKYKGSYTFTGGKAVGYRNLFALPWTSFMAEDSLYFINDVLHLRAELIIRH